jgi:hypothetical protein
MIESWVYDRITSNSTINSIIGGSSTIPGNCYPDQSDYSNIPCVIYHNISQKTNIFCRQPIISIRCVEQTQDLCAVLNEHLYGLFDTTTSAICEMYNGVRIEGVEIVNNIPTLYDFTNQKWHGILDIKIYYEK